MTTEPAAGVTVVIAGIPVVAVPSATLAKTWSAAAMVLSVSVSVPEPVSAFDVSCAPVADVF